MYPIQLPATGEREIALNVVASQEAKSIIALIESDCTQYKRQRFLELIREWVLERLPLPQPTSLIQLTVQPMSDDEAKQWERRPLEFGIHCGTIIGLVPTEYCVFVSGESEFAAMMRRYVRSDRFKKRVHKEDLMSVNDWEERK